MIDTFDDMMELLKGYRNNYNEYLMLSLKALPSSPSFDGVPGEHNVTIEQRWNKVIERKAELERKMIIIEEAVEALQNVSQDFYRVIYYHYISIDYPMSLNRISSELFGFDDYTNFWRGGWHKNSLNALFEIVKSKAKV